MALEETNNGFYMPVAPAGSGSGNAFGGDWAWIILLLLLGWGNGDPAFQHIERPVTYGPAASGPSGTPVPDRDARSISIVTFNGLAQVILIQPNLSEEWLLTSICHQ